MRKVVEILSKFGLSEKDIAVYLALLKLGPSPVRKVATEAAVNRGTTYDILKGLQAQGLTSYYHKEKHQYFVAEDPNKLFDAVTAKVDGFKKLREELNTVVPQLRSMSTAVEERPIVTYYDGLQGVRTILEDVLHRTTETKTLEYSVYSSTSVSRYLYAAYPEFTDERIARKIHVKVISLGAGGESADLAERKWLSRDDGAPTYTLLYAGRVAMISTDKHGVPMGLIVAAAGLYETQRTIFNKLWEVL